MCGIAGIFTQNVTRVDEKIVRNMCRAIIHRGPDDEGYYDHTNCVLGMRRLSIIDLETGHQPICNEDKTIWVVFNGEIYNFRTLRNELKKFGHKFYTNSDTEVIVHAYEEYGNKFMGKLNGMFSIAVFDTRTNNLLLVRDRLGIKQLYYTCRNGKFYFGSEIKSLLQVPTMALKIDKSALDIYFTLLYIPAPKTIFQGIRALKPGHLLVVEIGKKYEEISYWQLRPAPLNDMTEQEAVLGFRSHFEKAVERRMIADVPLGAFLSGGIDSSAVVAIMNKFSNHPVKTFSIGYGIKEAYYDERSFARIISKRYNTEHHEFVVTPDAKAIIPEIVKAFDQPFADSSAIPNYYINKMTRKHVTVALSGLGGDELAAGYERYLGIKLAIFYQKIPRWIRDDLVGKVVSRLPDSKKGKRFNDRAKRFIESGSLPLGKRYLSIISSFSEEQRQSLYAKEMTSVLEQSIPWDFINGYLNQTSHLDDLTQILCLDINTYLVDDLLTLTDRMSMQHSLEVRVPFLDHELVEFASTIPSRYKLKLLSKKYLLKKAFSDLLPFKILHRSKKGFSVPLVLWFRTSLLKYTQDILSREVTDRIGLFNQVFIDHLIDDHVRGKSNNHGRLWALIIFNVWYHLNIEPVLDDRIL